MNYIECINVDYKSTRKESFYGMFIKILDMEEYASKIYFQSSVSSF